MCALASVALAACAGGGGGARTATIAPSITPESSATPAATATADALASGQVDAQRAYDTVRKLAVDIGPRVAGTPAETAAADYIRATLESYGYDVTIEDFGFDASGFRPSRVDAGGEAIGAYAFSGSAEGTPEALLVNTGLGRAEEFPAAGLHGAIALIERGELTFSEKARNAAAAGAAAAVIYNNEEGALSTEIEAVPIPIVGITREAGQGLVARLAAGAVQAKVTVPAASATGHNVVAKPKGAGDCASVTGGHYDSVPVTGGADDNASGAAAVIETARVAAANHLAGANCFVLFSGEEFGLFGSRAFVGGLTPDQVEKLRVMVNLDVVGIRAPLGLIGDADVVDVARLQAEKIGVPAEPYELPANTGSDHISFRNAHVPVVMLTVEDALIHTQRDAIDRIDKGMLDETVRLAYATLSAIMSG